jgi:hypothetical protein
MSYAASEKQGKEEGKAHADADRDQPYSDSCD